VSDSDEKSARDKLKKLVPGRVLTKVPWSDIRKQLVTSLGVAFGALIGFIWTSVVQQAFVVAGVITATGITSWGNWFIYVIGAFVVTFIAVILLVFIVRIQTKLAEKQE
jgi:hypothetical protein